MLLRKFICMQKIQANQSMNIWLKKRENVGIKHYNDPTAFFECSDTIDDIFEDIDNYNPKRDKKVWNVLMTWKQILWQMKNFKP